MCTQTKIVRVFVPVVSLRFCLEQSVIASEIHTIYIYVCNIIMEKWNSLICMIIMWHSLFTDNQANGAASDASPPDTSYATAVKSGSMDDE